MYAATAARVEGLAGAGEQPRPVPLEGITVPRADLGHIASAVR